MTRAHPITAVYLQACVIAVLVNGMSAQHSVSTGSSPVISCFIEGWSVLRPVGAGKFSLDDIDPSLCTHLVFLFAGLDDDRSTISLEAEYDTEGAFRQLVAIKARVPSLHVTVAIGGWTEGSEGFSKMASSQRARKTFIDSVLENLRRYKLDGLDIFWQNPAQKIQKGRPEDKQNYVTLVKELKEALRPEGFSLTVAVMSGKSVIDDGYDLPGLAEHVDFMYLLTYDYHGKWERNTGLNAPLYPRSGETGLARTNNVNFTVSYVLAMGVPPEKIVLGLALFGRTFFLADRRNHRVGAAALEGDPSSGDGLLSYLEICKRIESEGIVWSIAREQEQRAPYIYGGTEWIGYDDSLSLTEKIDLAKRLRLRGVSAFAISTDDFKGECNAGKYPLLRTINAEMRDYSIELNQPQRPAVVACFYQSWSVYRESLGKFQISDIDPSLCTHIIFSFVGLDESNLTIIDLDPYYVQRGAYDELRQLRTLNPNIVITVAVGGYDEGSKKFSRMVATAENRKKFISSVLDFLRRTLLDGIDLAWMDPTFREGKPEDRENFALLVQELSEAFAPPGYHLGVTVSGRSSTLRQGYDLSAIGKAADVVHILVYNFHGSWEDQTGHTSPLFPSDEESVQSNDAATFNMDSALRAVLAGGVPTHKIAVSLPLFSNTFILRDPTQNYYGAPTLKTGFQGPYTKVNGYVGYNEICEMQLEQDRRQQQNLYAVRGWTIDWHEQHRVPYMYKDDKWAGFDNATTIEERVRLALSHGVNGIGVWSVDTDDFRGVCGTGKYPLLSAINRVLKENKMPDKQRPDMVPSSTTERNVPTMSRPVSGCSVVATSNVSVAVLSCGSRNDDPAECDAGDTVPPQTVVLATCWETADMTVRCHDDGFWKPFIQEDGWLEKKMAILCQPYYLNSEVCGRRTRYASTGAVLNTQDFDRPRNRWPWVASLLRDDAHACTATVITPVYLLTAAHCVTRTPETSTEAIESTRLKVEAGAAHSRLEVKEIRLHPSYQTGRSPRNDIALVELQTPLVYSAELYPACVANAELNARVHAVAFNRSFGKPTFEFEVVGMKVSPECRAQVNECPTLQLSESQFCAEGRGGGSVLLVGGSSGGPFLQNLVNESVPEAWTVSGVTSSSSRTVDCSVPVFTNVHLFSDWLKDSVLEFMSKLTLP